VQRIACIRQAPSVSCALLRGTVFEMAHKRLKGKNKTKGSNVRKSLKEQAKKKSKKQANQPEGAKAAPPPAKVDGPEPVNKKQAKAQALLEKQNRSLYSGNERVLLVGEGNFSFARALCEHLGSGAGIYATALDSEAEVKTKYPDAAEHRRVIEDKLAGTTLLGVDATRLHKVKEFRGAFKKVVFNFPHIGGGEKDVEKSVAEHRKLLAAFFSSAARCLDPEAKGACIHVALKVGEPYKSWKVVQTARAACPDLDITAAVPFVPSAWPGYVHRRTHGFDSRFSSSQNEEIAKGAKVYIFRKRKLEAGEI